MNRGFFPTPYPDECLYSILCRYCVRIGCTELKNTRKLLFGGQQCLASTIFFPIRLDVVEHWYGANSGVTRKLIANEHTLHPYMVIVYPDRFRQQFDTVINGGIAPKTFDKTGTQRSHRLWPKYLRYCPDCVRDDILAYGETYWHRTHQLPGMMYCIKHIVRLHDSDIEVVGSRMGFHPASTMILSENYLEHDSLEQHKEKFIKIGIESEWLLRHGADIDWGFDIHTKYKHFFRDRGIATVQGVSDYDLVASAFAEYWGQDFLDSLKLELDDNREWICQVYEARMVSFRPIYHILLMCFLCDSIESFINHEPQENIFGNSPRACINVLCEQGSVDGVKSVDIKYVNGVATGFLKCDYCGMVYKQVYRHKQFGELYIVEYGDVWINLMLRCLKEENLDIPSTAKILKCKPHVVKWQLRKLGLLGNPMYLKRSWKHDRKVGADSYYKAQVLALCEQYDEVTSDILKLHAPGAYKYLYKNDLQWLHKHMKLKVATKSQQDEDNKMLLQVKDAVTAIFSNGMPKRQITFGLIAVTAGFKIQALDYLAEKRPLTKAYINSVVESREDWLKRRITTIAHERKVIGEKITIADVKREMSLKPNTFVKYETFLMELIEQLNN